MEVERSESKELETRIALDTAKALFCFLYDAADLMDSFSRERFANVLERLIGEDHATTIGTDPGRRLNCLDREKVNNAIRTVVDQLRANDPDREGARKSLGLR